MKMKQKLFDYIKENLGVEPDYPFKEDIAIFRHGSNRKWFAAVIDNLPKSKLGMDDERKCDIVDLKCDPILSGSFLKQPGIFPGYHMNKEHWITALLDGTVDEETLFALVNISFEMTKSAAKRKR